MLQVGENQGIRQDITNVMLDLFQIFASPLYGPNALVGAYGHGVSRICWGLQ